METNTKPLAGKPAALYFCYVFLAACIEIRFLRSANIHISVHLGSWEVIVIDYSIISFSSGKGKIVARRQQVWTYMEQVRIWC